MVVVVDEDEEEGSPFSKVPSAASVQRYRHEILCPKTTAPEGSRARHNLFPVVCGSV